MENPNAVVPADNHQHSTDIMIPAQRMDIMIQTRNAIKQFIANQLRKDVDYGLIPGTHSPTLLQPGMQKINSYLGVYPDNDVKIIEMGDGHREYQVKTTMRKYGSDAAISTGIGSCSTMESKYRYRHAPAEDTGKAVPKAYWDHKKGGNMKAALDVIGGKGHKVEKTAAGRWTIHKLTGDKVEAGDPADNYNTCLKMATKRANMSATINLLGGWTEQFMNTPDADDPEPVEPDPEPAPASNTPAVDLVGGSPDEIRELYKSWAKPKQEAFQRYLSEKQESMGGDDAVVAAYELVEKYYQ